LELPFQYLERGEPQSALVKVVLCDKCCRKLMWKREKEKQRQLATESAPANATSFEAEDALGLAKDVSSDDVEESKTRKGSSSGRNRDGGRSTDAEPTRRRNSRSRSPVRRHRNDKHLSSSVKT